MRLLDLEIYPKENIMETANVYQNELKELAWCPECSTKTMTVTQVFDWKTRAYIETVYECERCGHLI